MCVIFVAKEARPTEEMVRAAYAQNSHGGGVAWRENDAEGVPEVAWEKGLDLEQMVEKAAALPLPFVMHFRVSTVGGTIKRLTHPFPVDPAMPQWLTGRIKGHVVFHNGHWSDWKNATETLAIRGAFKIPSGKWSDSRAMAWVASHLGLGYLEFLTGQKIVAFGPSDEEEIQVFGEPWFTVDGILCSNTIWERKSGVWTETKGGRTITHYPTGPVEKTLRATTLPDDEDDDPPPAQAKGPIVTPETPETEDHFRRPIRNIREIIDARKNSHQFPQATGGSPAGSPFVEKKRGDMIPGTTPTRSSTQTLNLCKTWKDVHSLMDANRLRAEGNLSKSQYKKFIAAMNREATKVYQRNMKAEREEAMALARLEVQTVH